MPKVSVLVPVYNVEKYLPECLDSLINQTLKDIEIICINDGSTDSCPKILNEYASKDSRIKVINKENSGYGHSMNMGLDAAEGDYIGILESDDFADTNMFEDLYNLALESDADVVKSDWYNYYTKNNGNHKIGWVSGFDSRNTMNARDNKKLLIAASIWSCLYKKDFLKKNEIRFLESPGASYQDTSFSLKAMMTAEKIKLTPEAYVHYRQDNLSASCKNKAKVYCICDEYEEIEHYMNSHPQLIEPFMEYINALRFEGYMWNLERIDKTFAEDFLDRFQKDFQKIYESGYCGETFFAQVRKDSVRLLLENKEKFYKKFLHKRFKQRLREFRRNIISIRINSSGLRLVLFGKQITGIE